MGGGGDGQNKIKKNILQQRMSLTPNEIQRKLTNLFLFQLDTEDGLKINYIQTLLEYTIHTLAQTQQNY